MNLVEKLAAAAIDVGKAAAVAALEPRKTDFRIRSAQVGAITKTLRALGHDEVGAFASPKGRDDFLWATANYLELLDHEELIVAFGVRRGRPRAAGACLRRVHRSIGERDSVALTPRLLSLLETALRQDGAEILLIHNHPANPVKTAHCRRRRLASYRF
jgi:hypothetical protein